MDGRAEIRRWSARRRTGAGSRGLRTSRAARHGLRRRGPAVAYTLMIVSTPDGVLRRATANHWRCAASGGWRRPRTSRVLDGREESPPCSARGSRPRVRLRGEGHVGEDPVARSRSPLTRTSTASVQRPAVRRTWVSHSMASAASGSGFGPVAAALVVHADGHVEVGRAGDLERDGPAGPGLRPPGDDQGQAPAQQFPERCAAGASGCRDGRRAARRPARASSSPSRGPASARCRCRPCPPAAGRALRVIPGIWARRRSRRPPAPRHGGAGDGRRACTAPGTGRSRCG